MEENLFDFSTILNDLPPVVWRADWNKLASKHGLPYRRSYMQNLDSEDKGPPKIYFKKRVGYPREKLIQWFNSRCF